MVGRLVAKVGLLVGRHSRGMATASTEDCVTRKVYYSDAYRLLGVVATIGGGALGLSLIYRDEKIEAMESKFTTLCDVLNIKADATLIVASDTKQDLLLVKDDVQALNKKFRKVTEVDLPKMTLQLDKLLAKPSMGQSKAKSVCALLQELNESVGAKFVEESPEAMLESNPGFFAQFTLVIATQI